MYKPKEKTRSFANLKSDYPKKEKFGFSPEKSEGRSERYSQSQEKYKIRFKRKVLDTFEPKLYVTAQLSIDDVIDLK
jgi:uncharacterized protein (DUF4415 family)